MQPDNAITNIDEETILDRATALQLAKIFEYLRDIED